MTTIPQRVAQVQARIARSAASVGRDPAAVRIVAASKTRTVDEILAAARTGSVHAFGENRIQEALPKIAATHGQDLDWHFIGRLQRNKVRDLAPFGLVHGVDTDALVDTISARCPASAVLVQVNVSGEARKGGVAPEDAAALVRRALGAGLQVEGLMTMAPMGDTEAARACFAGLARLRSELVTEVGAALPELSMGMSDDFEIGVEEGATLVRVGRALFGERLRDRQGGGTAVPTGSLPGTEGPNM